MCGQIGDLQEGVTPGRRGELVVEVRGGGEGKVDGDLGDRVEEGLDVGGERRK